MKRKVIIGISALVLVAAAIILCMFVLDKEPKQASPVLDVEITMSLDSNGRATWTQLEGAVCYEYSLIGRDGNVAETMTTSEAWIYLPEDHCALICAVFKDGSRIDLGTTPLFVPNAMRENADGADPSVSGEIAFGTVSGNGMNVYWNGADQAWWMPVEGAVQYGYYFTDAYGADTETAYTRETAIVVPDGCMPRIWVVYEDGTEGDWRFTMLLPDDTKTADDGKLQPDAMAVLPDIAPVELVMDENGMLTWEGVEGAIGYCYEFYDAYAMLYAGEKESPYLQLVSGTYAKVAALTADGRSEWVTSPAYGTAAAVDGEQVKMTLVTTTKAGHVTWDKMPGAVAYEVLYASLDSDRLGNKKIVTDENSVVITDDYIVYITPIYEHGMGTTIASGVLIDAAASAVPDYSRYAMYDFIAHILPESFATAADGTVTFTAEGPDGRDMRFEGKGIVLCENGLEFMPGGWVMALDAIGTIHGFKIECPEADGTSSAFSGGYMMNGGLHAENASQVLSLGGQGMTNGLHNDVIFNSDVFSSNFIGFTSTEFNEKNFVATAMPVYYSTDSYHTGIKGIALDPNLYGVYMEGDPYPLAKEGLYSQKDGVYVFALFAAAATENSDIEQMHKCIVNIDKQHFSVGDLKDKDGNVLDKATAALEVGCTLDVTIGQYTYPVTLPVRPYYRNGENLYELHPEGVVMPEGEINALVIPVAWADENRTAEDEVLDLFKRELGRVSDLDGNVQDYTLTEENGQKRYSLSSYFETASYGKLMITSYMLDWYEAPYTFAEMRHRLADDRFLKEAAEWLYNSYPDMDWKKFDMDRDGYFDYIYFLNAGDLGEETETDSLTFAGGYNQALEITTEKAGTPYRPAINNLMICHVSRMDGNNVIIHEFGHGLGLIDYYDMADNTVNAVGWYDMQAGNMGDWNAYSKFAVGWIDPYVVEGLEKGESVELTIGSAALSGDAIVIPAAEVPFDGSPFNEYVLLELFTADGLHAYDAPKANLADAAGVRIYHVNAAMEQWQQTYDLSEKKVFTYGIAHFDNTRDTGEPDKYHLELIQKGKENTFTNLEGERRTWLEEADLFRSGDVFRAEAYEAFFTNGLMDDGSAFGYQVEIVSVAADENGEIKAVIRVTRE